MIQTKSLAQRKFLRPSLFIFLGIIFTLLYIPNVVISEDTTPTQATSTPWSTKMKETVQNWMTQIQQKDPLFSDWENAKPEIQFLGPGSHQWLVIITKNDEDIGYLIVGLDQNEKFVLIEYGKGLEELLRKENSVQSLDTKDPDRERGMIYSGLFLGKIKIKDQVQVLHDVITGEAYEHVPITAITPYWYGEPVQQLVHAQKSHAPSIDPIVLYGSEQQETSTFTPDQSHMYTAEIIPHVTAIYEVLSWHEWDTTKSDEQPDTALYIGIEDEGVRFFSYSYLKQLGTFQSID